MITPDFGFFLILVMFGILFAEDMRITTKFQNELQQTFDKASELEAINQELKDALGNLVMACENHALIESVPEFLVSPNEILNQAKDTLAKARGEQL